MRQAAGSTAGLVTGTGEAAGNFAGGAGAADQVPRTDPLTHAVVASVFLLAATVAGFLPAWRASRIARRSRCGTSRESDSPGDWQRYRRHMLNSQHAGTSRCPR